MRTSSILVGLSLATASAWPQRLTVVLDAARGGTEYGARIDAHTYEKQVTLDLADRLKVLLAARDFNVVLTREGDALVTNEQRAAVANRSRPLACILLHATASGTGVHLWTSSLHPQPPDTGAVPWDEAQAPFLQRSERFASELAGAFSRGRLQTSQGHTWIRPLDNMQCPAVAIELAPEDSDRSAADHNYQVRVAQTIADQLLVWRNHAEIVQSIVNPPSPPAPPKQQSAPAAASPTNNPKDPRPASPSPGIAPGVLPVRSDKPKPTSPQETPPQ